MGAIEVSVALTTSLCRTSTAFCTCGDCSKIVYIATICTIPYIHVWTTVHGRFRWPTLTLTRLQLHDVDLKVPCLGYIWKSVYLSLLCCLLWYLPLPRHWLSPRTNLNPTKGTSILNGSSLVLWRNGWCLGFNVSHVPANPVRWRRTNSAVEIYTANTRGTFGRRRKFHTFYWLTLR